MSYMCVVNAENYTFYSSPTSYISSLYSIEFWLEYIMAIIWVLHKLPVNSVWDSINIL